MHKIHKNCTLLTDREFRTLIGSNVTHWSCRICNESLFAFNHIEDDHFCLLDLNLDNTSLSIVQGSNLILNPFDLNDDKDDIPLSDLDPDIAYYNNAHHLIYEHSDYFDKDAFNKSVTKYFNYKKTFSLFHLNIRSLPANSNNMLGFMSNLNLSFDIMGITENWLTRYNKDLYDINGYDHINNIRSDRAGGGVSLFISSCIKYKELPEYSLISEHIECMFIEVCIDDSTKILLK